MLDLGAKDNIARSLAMRGCDVTIYPALTAAADIIADKPDGIMLSNGPGDPKECESIIREIRKLYETDIPIFAICLGHQLMALATGADTFKMKYGHRGGNHPVKDLTTGRVYISSQNHGYVVDMDKLDPKVAALLSSMSMTGQMKALSIRVKIFSPFNSILRPAPDRKIPGFCLTGLSR